MKSQAILKQGAFSLVFEQAPEKKPCTLEELRAVLLEAGDDPFGDAKPEQDMDASFRNLYTEEIERFSLAVLNDTPVDIPAEGTRIGSGSRCFPRGGPPDPPCGRDPPRRHSGNCREDQASR